MLFTQWEINIHTEKSKLFFLSVISLIHFRIFSLESKQRKILFVQANLAGLFSIPALYTVKYVEHLLEIKLVLCGMEIYWIHLMFIKGLTAIYYSIPAMSANTMHIS